MRISTPQMFQTGVKIMQNAQAELNRTSQQMSTGRRILTPSDDPSGAALSVQLSDAIHSTKQYQRNVDYAQPRLEQEESQIEAVLNALQRVRELAVTGSNDTYNRDNRAVIAGEIRQLRDEIYDLGNTKFANGEYLFAGTRSQTAPFVIADDGQVSYVGATGEGAVREVAITNTRKMATGDTGAHLLMEIPERSGLLTEAVPKATNAGDLGVTTVAVADLEDALNSAGETYRIRFTVPAAPGGDVEYDILDLDGNAVRDANGDLLSGTHGSVDAGGNYVTPVPNDPIVFAGRSVTLTGAPTAPDNGDEIISRPIERVSLFQTLDSIATAFETAGTDDAGREALSRASSIALRNIDSGLDRLNDVRATVGVRIAAMETQTDLNDQNVLDLTSTLSDVRDLDYADAISRYKLQEVALQAAQQTYVQVNKLSLFDFL